MNIIILGPPGSGKGTQSQFLVHEYHYQHLSTGDLLRDEIAQNSILGQKASSYINVGQYVPDEIMNDILSEKLLTIITNFILDGYPRTIEQAHHLDKILVQLKQKIDIVFYLDINEQTVINRLATRLTCPVCKTIYNVNFFPPRVAGICDKDGVKLTKRTDDSDQHTIITRLNAYKKSTAPLVSFYQDRGLLKVIDANQENVTVKTQITKYLAKELHHNG